MNTGNLLLNIARIAVGAAAVHGAAVEFGNEVGAPDPGEADLRIGNPASPELAAVNRIMAAIRDTRMSGACRRVYERREKELRAHVEAKVAAMFAHRTAEVVAAPASPDDDPYIGMTMHTLLQSSRFESESPTVLELQIRKGQPYYLLSNNVLIPASEMAAAAKREAEQGHKWEAQHVKEREARAAEKEKEAAAERAKITAREMSDMHGIGLDLPPLVRASMRKQLLASSMWATELTVQQEIDRWFPVERTQFFIYLSLLQRVTKDSASAYLVTLYYLQRYLHELPAGVTAERAIVEFLIWSCPWFSLAQLERLANTRVWRNHIAFRIGHMFRTSQEHAENLLFNLNGLRGLPLIDNVDLVAASLAEIYMMAIGGHVEPDSVLEALRFTGPFNEKFGSIGLTQKVRSNLRFAREGVRGLVIMNGREAEADDPRDRTAKKVPTVAQTLLRVLRFRETQFTDVAIGFVQPSEAAAAETRAPNPSEAPLSPTLLFVISADGKAAGIRTMTGDWLVPGPTEPDAIVSAAFTPDGQVCVPFPAVDAMTGDWSANSDTEKVSEWRIANLPQPQSLSIKPGLTDTETGFDAFAARHAERLRAMPVAWLPLRMALVFSLLSKRVEIPKTLEALRKLGPALAVEEPLNPEDVATAVATMGLQQMRLNEILAADAWAQGMAATSPSPRLLDEAELRRCAYETGLPVGIGIAKACLTLSLIGNDLPCLDVRIIRCAYGERASEAERALQSLGRKSRTKGTLGVSVLSSRNAIDDYMASARQIFEHFAFADPSTPFYLARSQWALWERCPVKSDTAQTETHSEFFELFDEGEDE